MFIAIWISLLWLIGVSDAKYVEGHLKTTSVSNLVFFAMEEYVSCLVTMVRAMAYFIVFLRIGHSWQGSAFYRIMDGISTRLNTKNGMGS